MVYADFMSELSGQIELFCVANIMHKWCCFAVKKCGQMVSFCGKILS